MLYNNINLIPGISDSKINFHIVDAGCRNGFKDLNDLHPFIHFIGFDPSTDSYKKGNTFLSEKFLPYGLYHASGQFDFYECNHPSMSSMLEFDKEQFVKHFGLMENSSEWFNQLSIKNKTKIQTMSLEELFISEKLSCIDFLKLDTQGTELSVLHGAENLLKKQKIGIIKCEVAFVPVYKNQALFYEIANYLSLFGYKLANLMVYPDAVNQHGSSQLKLNTFKEKIRYASGGDALFYLDNQDRRKDELQKTGIMLASEQVFSLSYHYLHAIGINDKEIVLMFEFFRKQHRKKQKKRMFHNIKSLIIK